MWYHNLTNHIYENDGFFSIDRGKIKIVNLAKTNKQILMWNDKILWGSSLGGRKFIMYSKVRMFEKIPVQLIDNFIGHSEFIRQNNDLVCKTVGRYTATINDKHWVIDVIFPESFDKKWSKTMRDEYISGTTGIHSNWKYDIQDSAMAEFAMSKIEQMPYKDRTIFRIIRRLMSEFSSENSPTALIEGRWDQNYKDGRTPNDWVSTSEVFREWNIDRKPIKYGQCWIFAECMTCVMRFLGIPASTIFAENSHINPSLNCGIDMLEDSEGIKSGGNTNMFLKLNNMETFLSATCKDDPWDKCTMYNGEDSIWNIHYWNEIYIPGNLHSCRNGIP